MSSSGETRLDPITELARELIRHASVTPDDAGCQDIIADRLSNLGFHNEWINRGEVRNLWSVLGHTGPLFVFAGHTDVVPTGPAEEWTHPPFEAHVENGILHGRGAADMKGNLAAMIVAVEEFLRANPAPGFRIGFLVTSDEEGPARDGTRAVMEELNSRGEKIDYCVVGEPSSREVLGDVIRVGRRGSLNGHLTVRGKQGHVAYPELARNPIHLAVKALNGLVERRWDNGYESFPPTSFQVSNIHSGSGADNVIPGKLECSFNFRYSPALTAKRLRQQVEEEFRHHDLDFEIDWRESGEPFYTDEGKLRNAVDAAIRKITGHSPEHSTGGGTSDGRYIAPHGVEVVELGVVNATIHQVNECIELKQLADVGRIYTRILEELAS